MMLLYRCWGLGFFCWGRGGLLSFVVVGVFGGGCGVMFRGGGVFFILYVFLGGWGVVV